MELLNSINILVCSGSIVVGVIVGIYSIFTEEPSKSMQDQILEMSEQIGWRESSMDDHLMMLTSMRLRHEYCSDIAQPLDSEIKRLRDLGAKLPWDRKSA